MQNTGSIPIIGTVALRVMSDQGGEIKVYEIPFPELAPGAHTIVHQAWDTEGASSGAYQILGYARYRGKATEPMTIEVVIQSKVFLPLVIR